MAHEKEMKIYAQTCTFENVKLTKSNIHTGTKYNTFYMTKIISKYFENIV